VSQRKIWEEGHETGRRVAVLGVALALTIAAVDLILFDRLTALFDVGFVLLCVVLALLVRPADFFTVGVLPPLLMVGVLALIGGTRPQLVADPGDGLVQAMVTGLSQHAGALITGYLLSLAVLAIRHRVIGRAQAATKRAGSPAPTRTTSG
jgi:hypothetical protein